MYRKQSSGVSRGT